MMADTSAFTVEAMQGYVLWQLCYLSQPSIIKIFISGRKIILTFMKNSKTIFYDLGRDDSQPSSLLIFFMSLLIYNEQVVVSKTDHKNKENCYISTGQCSTAFFIGSLQTLKPSISKPLDQLWVRKYSKKPRPTTLGNAFWVLVKEEVWK